LSNYEFYKVHFLVIMIVGPVISGVFMVVNVSWTAMTMLVDMLVEMFMRVSVGVLVAMLHVPVGMFVSVHVIMFMCM